jgi:heat shock protein HslJ
VARRCGRQRGPCDARAAVAVWRWLVAAIALASVVGCGPAARLTTLSDDVRLDGGTWVLSEGIVDGEVLNVPAGHRVSLTVTGADAGGTAACNEYGARIEQDGDRLTFGELGATAVGCERAVMAAEDRYLAGLERVTAAARDDGVLMLTGPDTSLVFTRQPPVDRDEIVGRTWTLTTLTDGGTSTAVQGRRATLRLRTDGTVTGGTGCRALTGTYTVRGDEIFFPDFGADGRCPAGLWDQDNHVVDVLGDGFRATVDGRRLTITSDRDLGLRYVARTP